MTKTTIIHLNASNYKQPSYIRQATSLKSWEFFYSCVQSREENKFQRCNSASSYLKQKGIPAWDLDWVSRVHEGKHPSRESQPTRTQELRVSLRESNASSRWGFLGCQCYSAGYQHCIQSTPPRISWETAPQIGELFHLVLFKPQKAILSTRI